MTLPIQYAAAYAMENVRAAAGDVENDGKNRHGYLQGYHFVPKENELIRLLDDKLAGRPLPYPLPNIFHDVPILDFHPAELYEAYKAHEEAGSIYFFSRRKFPTPRGARTNPVRVAKDGWWKASGGSKPVSTMKRGGVNVGYHLTLVFYENEPADDNSSGKTDWGIHEFSRIIGPNKKADLALYCLYKKKNKKEEKKEAGQYKKKNKKEEKKEAGQHVAALPNGPPKLEELPSPRPTSGGTSTASTSQAHAQASVGQAHDCYQYHQDAFGAAASAPGPSSWVALTAVERPMQVYAGCMGLTGSPPAPSMTPSPQATTVNYSLTLPKHQSLSLQAIATPSMSPQQQAGDDFDLADWDDMPPLLPLLAPLTVSGPAAIAHGLPASQQQDAEYPGPADSYEQMLNMLPPPPLPAPAAEGYLDDEFKVWGEMQQEQPAMSPCWFPMPEDDDLPMLMDEEKYEFTLEELLAGMHDEATTIQERPDTNDQVQSSKSNQ